MIVITMKIRTAVRVYCECNFKLGLPVCHMPDTMSPSPMRKASRLKGVGALR